MNSIHTFVDVFDLTGSVIKAIFFGNVIAVLGCYYGLHSPDGAEGLVKRRRRRCFIDYRHIYIERSPDVYFVLSQVFYGQLVRQHDSTCRCVQILWQ